MKKAVEFLKANKTTLIIICVIVALVIAMIIWGGGSEGVSVGSESEKTVTEQKLERLLSQIDGVGKTDVMINENEGTVDGVVIVCQGANNIMTRNDIINAVSTALNIQKNIIAVYAMN